MFVLAQFPLYPQKRTLLGGSWMFTLCQKQTSLWIAEGLLPAEIYDRAIVLTRMTRTPDDES